MLDFIYFWFVFYSLYGKFHAWSSSPKTQDTKQTKGKNNQVYNLI